MSSSLKQQILQTLEVSQKPGNQCRFTTRTGEVLRYGPEYESVEDFLSTVYARLFSQAEKKSFRLALSELFAEYLKTPWGVDRNSPAITLLYLVVGTRAYRQLPKFVSAFNSAELDAGSVDQLLYTMLCILPLIPGRALARRLLAQLVDGPNFQAAYAVAALEIELDRSPSDVHATIRKYAPMAHSVLAIAGRCTDEDDKHALSYALAGLQASASRPRIRRRVNDVFRMYHTRPGRWPTLFARIIAAP